MIATLVGLVLSFGPGSKAEFCQTHCLFGIGGQVVVNDRYARSPESIVESIDRSGMSTVALVIHGGLVNAESGLETAMSVDPSIRDVCYPVYYLWESGVPYSIAPPRAPRHASRPDPAEPLAAVVPYPLKDADRRLEIHSRPVGRAMWSNMNRYARLSSDPKMDDAVLIRFFRALAPVWKRKHLRVVLIGHSAGSIVITHLLERAEDACLADKVDVVFLAPAVSYATLARRADALSAWVSGFRMFALSDPVERADRLLAIGGAMPKQLAGWYSASLLYYVSNNVESGRDTPLLGMERFYSLATGRATESARVLNESEMKAYQTVDDVLHIGRNTVWSHGPDPAESPYPNQPGWICNSVGHGRFWGDSATMQSLHAILERPMPPKW